MSTSSVLIKVASRSSEFLLNQLSVFKRSSICQTVHILQNYNFPAFRFSHAFPSVRYFKTRSSPVNSAMASPLPVKEVSVSPGPSKGSQSQGEGVGSQATNNPRSAIIRHLQNQERFQLKLIHKKRVFNFDRATADTIQTLIDRITTNLSKKVKNWTGTAALLTSATSNEQGVKKSWTEIPDKSIETSELLKQIASGAQELIIQIDDEVYDVVLNPPEILSIKFFKQVIGGFPMLPYKIETSNNFDKDMSKYSWEFTRKANKPGIQGKPKKQKLGEVSEVDIEDKSIWSPTGCTSFVFVPGEELVGARLRFTCIPSDGKCFGLPFSTELTETVSSPTVSNHIYLERLERMNNSQNVDQKNPNFFRVVSYNCLAECYATEEWFPSSPKLALAFDFRLPFLCKEFSAYNGDIFCLQEVEAKYYERIVLPYFESMMDYKGFYSSKISVNEGLATIYNPRKLKPLKSETVVIAEHIRTLPFWGQLSTSSPAISTRLQERNSVLQVSIFRAADQENIVLIANTHLYFHPDADHIRLLQTMACVDYIETIVTEVETNFPGQTVVVLFCGDFNCTPPFSSYRFLTSGKINEDDFDWTSHSSEKLEPGILRQHNLKLTNSHPGEQLTNITSCFEGCIDYILYQAQHFKLLNTYPPPDKTVLASIFGVEETRLAFLPNFHAPSDHLPLIADVLLKSKH